MKTKVHYWRKRRVLTLEKLAHLSQVHIVTLSRIENGLSYPYPSTLEKIASALTVSPEDLVTDDTDPEADGPRQSHHRTLMVAESSTEYVA